MSLDHEISKTERNDQLRRTAEVAIKDAQDYPNDWTMNWAKICVMAWQAAAIEAQTEAQAEMVDALNKVARVRANNTAS